MSVFVGAVVGYLDGSSFPHPRIASLRVELERDERAAGAVVTAAIPARTSVRPGEELVVTVALQPDRGAPLERRVSLTVPRTATPGALDLIVADGAAWSEYRLRSQGLVPASFADEVAHLRSLDSAATLVFALEVRERGIARPGASQPALPPSWSATLALGLGVKGVTRLSTATVAETRWQAEYPLVGAFRVPLTVLPQRQEVR